MKLCQKSRHMIVTACALRGPQSPIGVQYQHQISRGKRVGPLSESTVLLFSGRKLVSWCDAVLRLLHESPCGAEGNSSCLSFHLPIPAALGADIDGPVWGGERTLLRVPVSVLLI